MAKISTTVLDNLSRGELKEIAKFLTDSLNKDPLTRWMLCNDEEAIAEKFPKMVLMDLSVPCDERKGIFVTRLYGGMGEGRKSHELVAAAVWRKSMEHVKVEQPEQPEPEVEVEVTEEKQKPPEKPPNKKDDRKKDAKTRKAEKAAAKKAEAAEKAKKAAEAAEKKKQQQQQQQKDPKTNQLEKEKEKAKMLGGDGKDGKNTLFCKRNQLIVEKFHAVKFDIFPIMKYDKPIVYISWIGTLDPFEQYSDTIIKEIFKKSEADEEELICMLGSNDRNEQCYAGLGFKTISHVLLADVDIENVDVIYDSIGAETQQLVENQQVEIFTMIREPDLPDIPFLVPR